METKWLADLEKKVDKAAAELASLRKQNKSQAAKIKKLEDQLAEAAGGAASAADWDQERDEIRKRVEKLSAGLEKLL
jgi:predicted RNase H-like nuclease (RuvC/YqgF family)